MFKKLFQGAGICLFGALLVGCESDAATGILDTGGGAIGTMSYAPAGSSIDEAWRQPDRGVREPETRPGRSYYNPSRTTAADAPISRYDVVNWTERGVRDDVIIDRIERSRTVFQLTAADENWLRDRGVSAMVVTTMRDTSRR